MALSILVVLLSPFSSSLSLGPDGFIVHLCELKRRNSVDFVMLAVTGSGMVAMERDIVRLSDKGAVATSLEPIRLWGWRRHRRTVFFGGGDVRGLLGGGGGVVSYPCWRQFVVFFVCSSRFRSFIDHGVWGVIVLMACEGQLLKRLKSKVKLSLLRTFPNLSLMMLSLLCLVIWPWV